MQLDADDTVYHSPAAHSMTPERSERVVYFSVLLASTFLLGSSFVSAKVLIIAGVPPILLAGWRFLIAALATLPLVFLERPRSQFPWQLPTAQAITVVFIGVLQTAAVMTLLFTSLKTIPSSTAAILMATNPLWVAVGGRFVLGETLSWKRSVGLLIGIVGVVLAIGIGGASIANHAGWTGEGICLAGSICWAAATLVSKRAPLAIGPWALNFWQMLIGALGLLGLAYVQGEQWPSHLSTTEWMWFVWLAIPGSTAAFGLWFIALQRGGAVRTSSFLFLVPLFATLLALVVFGSEIGPVQILGGVLIALALWLINSHATQADRSK